MEAAAVIKVGTYTQEEKTGQDANETGLETKYIIPLCLTKNAAAKVKGRKPALIKDKNRREKAAREASHIVAFPDSLQAMLQGKKER